MTCENDLTYKLENHNKHVISLMFDNLIEKKHQLERELIDFQLRIFLRPLFVNIEWISFKTCSNDTIKLVCEAPWLPFHKKEEGTILRCIQNVTLMSPNNLNIPAEEY